MDNEVEPAAPGAMAAAPRTGGAISPLAGASPAPPANPAGPPAGPVPMMSAPAGRGPRTGGAGPANLSATSWLDQINHQMFLLNQDMTRIGEKLQVLQFSADQAEDSVTNVDELSKLYEAPVATREATDATSMVASLITDMVAEALVHAHNTQACNANGKLGLSTVNAVQESQRAIGAGPRLLASAGR